MKLTVTIITLNEEQDLHRALSSVKEIADEIILVDSGSTDKTLSIAKGFKCKIFKRKFDDFASQKNFAASKASGEWILSLDADEEISSDLAKEIKAAISSSEFTAYSLPRRNFILGKEIKYTRWQKELDRHTWLWKKNRGRWVGDVHEELEVSGKVGRLTNAKLHYQYKTVSDFIEMTNKYSSIDAKMLHKKGQNFSFIKMMLQIKYNFFVRYLYRLGFLDGWRGFVLSILMAIYHFQVWAKLWHLQEKTK